MRNRERLRSVRVLQTRRGSSFFGLYGRDDLAADAGVDPKGSGFQGITLNYLVSTSKQVDELLAQAKRAGGKIVKEAHKPQWGGYLGYFSDLDGYLWKVVVAGEQRESWA